MITCKFSCPSCGLVDHPVQVPARPTREHDVVVWVRDVVGYAIGIEHQRVSPRCKATRCERLMIPIAGSDFIGQQVE